MYLCIVVVNVLLLEPYDDPLSVETCVFISIYIFKCRCVRRSYCLLPSNTFPTLFDVLFSSTYVAAYFLRNLLRPASTRIQR
jgi:hypothetical protein